MQKLKTGEYYGQTNHKIAFGNVTITDTEYTHDYVDWHYHQNAYFTFILQGGILEGNKKETYHCTAGSLLFHNWQEAHYNIKPKGFTRGFHVELEPSWFNEYDVKISTLQGSMNLQHPANKLLMYGIFKESIFTGGSQPAAFDILLIDLFWQMTNVKLREDAKAPSWVLKLRDLLNDSPADRQWTLSDLAHEVQQHPVHISRSFTRYFNCSLGEYLRGLKLQKALALMTAKDQSLSQIAYQAGFADQSHFNRAFKTRYGVSPLAYRNMIYGR